MHARPVRQRGLNRAGETLLGRGLLLLPQGLNGPRNFRIILKGPLLQDERVVGQSQSDSDYRKTGTTMAGLVVKPGQIHGGNLTLLAPRHC